MELFRIENINSSVGNSQHFLGVLQKLLYFLIVLSKHQEELDNDFKIEKNQLFKLLGINS